MSVARNADVEIYYEAIGPAGPPVLLMVNGLGSQCINYAEEWCQRFVDRGLQVIRFDNRDVGLSSHLAGAPVDEKSASYRLADMADGAIAVLDAADVERAHVMGLSMGGMIVQQLAIDHRDRLLSMTSVMSSTGEPEYGQSTPEAYALLTGAPATDRDSAIARHIAGLRVWGSPAYADEERWAADAGRAFDRSFDPAGVGRQFFAVGASGSRRRVARRHHAGAGDPRLGRHADHAVGRRAHGRADPRCPLRADRRDGPRLSAAALGHLGRPRLRPHPVRRPTRRLTRGCPAPAPWRRRLGVGDLASATWRRTSARRR